MSLVIIRYETHYGAVICKLHHHVGRISNEAAMSEQGEEGRAEHTPLRCVCVHEQCGRCAVPNPHHLKPVGEEVSDPGAQWLSQSKVLEFQFFWDHIVEG